MTEFIVGMLGMVMLLAAFVGGVVFSEKCLAYSNFKRKEPKKEDEKQKERLIAEQKAFEEQMSYSPAVAYRMRNENEDGE